MNEFEYYIRSNIGLDLMPLNQFENVFVIDFGCNICNMFGIPLYL